MLLAGFGFDRRTLLPSRRVPGSDTFNFALNFANSENIASVYMSGFQIACVGTGPLNGFDTFSGIISRSRPFLSYVLSIVPTSTGTLTLVFSATGSNDARVSILDNVRFDCKVLEPST